MSEGPTIGDWTQYGWIPDGASSFPARVRLRNDAWMVYYEPDVVVKREWAENLDELLAENAKLREKADRYYGMYVELVADDDVTLKQNAKLRELVRALIMTFENPADWFRWPELKQVARELGVEVDE